MRSTAVVAIILTASACASAPVLTSRRTIEAAKSGKLASFQKQLASDARMPLGNAEALSTLRQQLSQFARIDVEPAVLIASKKDPKGKDVEREYETIVTGSQRFGVSPRVLYTIRLHCGVKHSAVHYSAMPEVCTPIFLPDGNASSTCIDSMPGYDSEVDDETCSVSDIAAVK